MPEPITATAFAQQIKAKYPVYAQVPDQELVAKMLEKYPAYRAQVQVMPTSEAPSVLRRTAGVAGDLATGAAKGAGQTATNLGRLVHKIPLVSAATDALYGMPGGSGQAFTIADRVLAPTNTAQRIGKGAEQIAEVLIPGRAVTSAATSLAARTAPRLAPMVGKTAAQILPRAAVEAAGGAGLSVAQGGDPRIGAVAGLIPAASAGHRAAATALREQAEKKVVQALGPTKERFKAIAEKRAGEVLKRGLGGSREGLQTEARAAVNDLGDQIDDAIQQFGAREISTRPIMDALEASKAAFQTTKRIPMAEAVKRGLTTRPDVTVVGEFVDVPVVFDQRAITQLSKLQTTLTQLGDDARVDQLVALRRAWDNVVAQAGGFAHRAGGAIGIPLKEQTEAWAKREATGAIRKVLATDVPELAAVNKEFAFWKDLDDVLTQTLKRTQPQGPGLGRQVAGVAGTAAASAHGLGPAVLVGKLGQMAHTVFTSPRWRLVDARFRNALADALMSGSGAKVEGALLKIAAVEGSKLSPAAGR